MNPWVIGLNSLAGLIVLITSMTCQGGVGFLLGLRGAGQSVTCLGDSLGIEKIEKLLFKAAANSVSMPLLLLAGEDFLHILSTSRYQVQAVTRCFGLVHNPSSTQIQPESLLANGR